MHVTATRNRRRAALLLGLFVGAAVTAAAAALPGVASAAHTKRLPSGFARYAPHAQPIRVSATLN